MEENKWSVKAFTALEDIAKEVIISNITEVKNIEIWLSGSVGGSIHLSMILTFSDDGTEKITYKIPKDIQSELEESPEKMIEFAVGYVAKHMLTQIFRIKLNNRNNGSNE